MLVTLLEGCPIHQFDLVLNQGCFAQVQVTEGKQVFPFELQLPGLFLFCFRPLLYVLEVQLFQDPSFLGATGRPSLGFPLGEPLVVPDWPE